MTAVAHDVAPVGGARAATPKRRLPRALVWGVPIAAVLATGGVVAKRYASAHPAPVVRYETAPVDRGPIAAKVTATGNLSALITVQVGSQVSGRIATLGADFGSTVKKDQVVATIEPSLFRAAADQARANLISAEATVVRSRAQVFQTERVLERAKALLADTLLSQQDYDGAEADVAVARANLDAALAGVAQAKAALEQAALNLKYTTIISPIDGTVISRNVDVGQTVAATLAAPTLFTVAEDLTKMQVDTNVAEGDVGKIRPGMDVTFTVDAYPQRPFHGVVRQVRDNATMAQNVVTYDAVIDVENRERLLKPGMTASVTFTYATRDDALRLPNAALRFKPDAAALATMTGRRTAPVIATAQDERTVWVLQGGRPSLVTARVGISDGASTELTGDTIHAGDAVVVEVVPLKKD